MSGVSSYPRTRGTYVPPEVIRALLEDGLISESDVQGYSKDVLGGPPSGRELIKEIVRVVLKDRRDDTAFLDRVNAALILRNNNAQSDGGRASVMVYHHTGARALSGFRYKEVIYTRKHDRDLYRRERDDFDRKERVAWIRDIAANRAPELIAAGLSQSDIDRMVSAGKAPDGYQVHHRIPLDDGGTNAHSNFILIKNNVEHRALHGYYNPAELRIRHLADGESATVALAVPPDDTMIYPNPAMGYVSEPVGYAEFLEIFDEH